MIARKYFDSVTVQLTGGMILIVFLLLSEAFVFLRIDQ